MLWEAMADQGYELPNNRFYVRSRVLGLPWLTRLPEGLHEITGRAWSSAGSITYR